MGFASYTYVLFLTGTACVYWLVPDRHRNSLLLAASYAFYCSWQFEFLCLLIAITLLNHFVSASVAKNRKYALALSILMNLLPLFFFRYVNHFLPDHGVLHVAGYVFPIGKITFPPGISFITFQAICYQIEVHGGVPRFTNLRGCALYLALFPKLIAGPIVRPEYIQEQIYGAKVYQNIDIPFAARRIVCGLFKKIVLADNLASIVGTVFQMKGSPLGGADVVFGVLAFGLQIYFDFSGYTDIAIGSASIFGYRLPENFEYPYSSRSFSEFWTKWHITLSSWIRDYVYMPLALTFGGKKFSIYAITIFSMILFGYWHGASVTFVLWGMWHGILIVLQNTVGKPLFSSPKGWRKAACVALTFVGVNIGWLFFRAESIQQITSLVKPLLNPASWTRVDALKGKEVALVLVNMAGLAIAMYLKEKGNFADILQGRKFVRENYRYIRRVVIVAMVITLVVMERSTGEFMYFQF